MSDRHMIPRAFAYRWLAQFFLSPPDLTTLESYRSHEGKQLLSELQTDPALASLAGWIKNAVADDADIAQLHAQITSAFTQAFDMGGPRAPLPYASAYLSEKGLLFQKPTRDMIALLEQLQLRLPRGVNEPADHLGVQLHVAAELIEREGAGHPVPVPSSVFVKQQVLTWLPKFVQRCANLSEKSPVNLFAQAALKLIDSDVKTAELCREPM